MSDKPSKPAKKTRVQLARKILELESQLAHRYQFANTELHRAGTKHLMASGVLLQLTAIGGKEIINPVMIKDGLSDETLRAIREDIKRSYELTTMYKVTDSKEI